MYIPVAIVLFGAFAGAWSAIFIRTAALPPALLASYRLLLAAVLLTPTFLRDAHRARLSLSPALLRVGAVPGIFLAAHFIVWFYGVRMTSVANTTLIVNMVPAAMPFFAFFINRERLTLRETLGTLVALSGLVLLGGSDFHLSAESFMGDLLSFVSMILFTVYLAFGKKKNTLPSLWLYVVPVYYWAGLFCLLVSFGTTPPWAFLPNYTDLLMVAGLAVVCTIGGQSIMNYGMKTLRSQTVSLLILTQFAWAAGIAFLLFREKPAPIFFPSAALILSGIGIVVGRRRGRKEHTIM